MKKHLLVFCFLLVSVALLGQQFQAHGYITYTEANDTKVCEVADSEEGGLNCTSMQGMAIGKTFCYVVKQKDNAYCDVTRINLDNKNQVKMKYYKSLSASSESECNVFGHGNELEIVEKGGEVTDNWLFAATLDDSKSIVRLRVEKDEMRLAGYYKVVLPDLTTVQHVSALKHWKTVGGYMYFIIKGGRNFYTAAIPLAAPTGTAAHPNIVVAYKLFHINVRHAVFATSNSAASHKDEIGDWENQGFGFNSSQMVIYVPLWPSTEGKQMKSVILTYNVADYVVDAAWLNPQAAERTIYPTHTSFWVSQNSGTLEIESASFRTGDNTTLYYNTNNDSASKEGVYAITLGATDFTPVPHYYIRYNANGGTGTMGTTTHVRGIASASTVNAFTREGYTFGGWHIHRTSDDMWLYMRANGTIEWYKRGTQPADAYLMLLENGHKFSTMTGVVGDVLTLYAYWKPNVVAGTKKFYVRYESNGGVGTMGETPVVYGQVTRTAKNVFVREGYTFVGWTTFRNNMGQWIYKNSSTLSDTWLSANSDKTGYIFQTNHDEADVAGSTDVDGDVITFYANWARVANLVAPTSVGEGVDFAIAGSVLCTTDMYGVVVNIVDKDGNVVQSYAQDLHWSRSTSTYAGGFDLTAANDVLDFASLTQGSYTYEVIVQTIAGTSPIGHVVHRSAFDVVYNPATMLEENSGATIVVHHAGDELVVEGVCARTMTLYTVGGQMLRTVSGSNRLSVRDVQGVYVVVVSDADNHRYVQKVIVQ